MHPEVPLGKAEAQKRIAPQVPLAERHAVVIRRWRTKGSDAARATLIGSVVKYLSPRKLRSVKIQWNSGRYVGSNESLGIVKELAEPTVIDGNRQGGMTLNETLERPTMQDCIRKHI